MPRAALCTAKGSIDQFCAKAIAGGFTAASAARLTYGAVNRKALQPFKLMNNVVIPTVRADADLTHWGCGVKLGLVYAVSPRLARYSRGLSEPREILMRFSLYQWMYASTTAMNCSMVAARREPRGRGMSSGMLNLGERSFMGQ